MKKILAIISVAWFFASVAPGEVYIFQDDVMGHRYWVNTDRAWRYGNQLLLPATITDYSGGRIITTDAMVTYDTRWGNVNMLHYGNYCILNRTAGQISGYALMAQTGLYLDNVTWIEDYIYAWKYGPTIGFDKKLPQFTGNLRPVQGKQDLLFPGSDSGKDDAINAVGRATEPAASDSDTPNLILTSTIGHRYYIYDSYRIGDLFFHFYVCTMTVEADSGPADGLMFLRDCGDSFFLVIITVFESEWLPAYSMAGIFHATDDSWSGHYFALISYAGTGSTVVRVAD